MTTLPALTLTQDPALTSGTRIEHWTGTVVINGAIAYIEWHRGADESDYTCEVRVPDLAIGSRDDVKADIIAALNRHAEAHGFDDASAAIA